jgi:hypothetical protein
MGSSALYIGSHRVSDLLTRTQGRGAAEFITSPLEENMQAKTQNNRNTNGTKELLFYARPEVIRLGTILEHTGTCSSGCGYDSVVARDYKKATTQEELTSSC